MTLFLTYGEPGVGKSSQHAALAKMLPNAIYLCMEYKDDKMLTMQGVNHIEIIQYDNDYNEDAIATLASLEKIIHEIIHTDKYLNVILDGISDIRKFAMKEWLYKDNLVRQRHGEKPRIGISGENLHAWQQINTRVTSILEPLINWSNLKKTNVFFTAQMKDSYLNDTKVGRCVAVGDWIEYDVDVRCFFTTTPQGYMATFTKVPRWAKPLNTESSIALDGFIMLLAERGLI